MFYERVYIGMYEAGVGFGFGQKLGMGSFLSFSEPMQFWSRSKVFFYVLPLRRANLRN